MTGYGKAALLFTALLSGGVASAAEPAPAEPAGTVYRLSPAEIASINPNPPKHDPVATYDPLFDKSLFDTSQFAPRRNNGVHGEVGAFVGSGGANGVFGTVGVPVGDNGFASFSYEQSNYGNNNGRRYRRR